MEHWFGDAGACPSLPGVPFQILVAVNSQRTLLASSTTDSFMVMIIISQFALQAEI